MFLKLALKMGFLPFLFFLFFSCFVFTGTKEFMVKGVMSMFLLIVFTTEGSLGYEVQVHPWRLGRDTAMGAANR